MKGSWSIKAVLPTIAPELDYSKLADVRDGGMTQQAYLEIIDPDTATERRRRLEGALKDHCEGYAGDGPVGRIFCRNEKGIGPQVRTAILMVVAVAKLRNLRLDSDRRAFIPATDLHQALQPLHCPTYPQPAVAGIQRSRPAAVFPRGSAER